LYIKEIEAIANRTIGKKTQQEWRSKAAPVGPEEKYKKAPDWLTWPSRTWPGFLSSETT